jgi:hypothetical protein
MVGISTRERRSTDLQSGLRRFGIQLLIIAVGAVGAVWFISAFGPSILSWGERRAFAADHASLSEAVLEYRVSPPALRPWPTLSGVLGVPTEGDVAGYQCDRSDRAEICSWIDFELLSDNGFLAATDIVNSADATLNVTATNAPPGHYGWFLTESGEVVPQPDYTRETGYP